MLVKGANGLSSKLNITATNYISSSWEWGVTYLPLHAHFVRWAENQTNPTPWQSTYLWQNATRQHSTQSVGNMPPPSPRHLLPHVLQIMPRNPKYDQFQPKGHHNEENPQSTTKMPGNPTFDPFHLVKLASKLEKSTNCNHNLISSESGQDISACKISGHFLNGFFRKCLETPNLTRFTKSK